MTVNMIAAIGLDMSLGANNHLLWKLQSDLDYFKKKTTGQTIVMGSNTYKSIRRPLPYRKNIVLSRNKELEVAEDVIVYDSVEDVLANHKNIFIIGGADVYRQFLQYTDRIYLTVVEGKFPEADTFFPALSEEWKCVSKYKRLKDSRNEYDHWYCVYEKD